MLVARGLCGHVIANPPFHSEAPRSLCPRLEVECILRNPLSFGPTFFLHSHLSVPKCAALTLIAHDWEGGCCYYCFTR
jgi:hypothetical protein